MVSHIFDDEFDISREFLDAWQNDELVFFVGAGVSMYEPTNLPSFAELTKKFCDKAGKSDCFYKTGGKKKTKLSEDEILNKLERDSHPVHKWANFDFLPEEKIKVNNLQDLIVKISTAQGRTFRIITTNYDNCLSKVIQNQKMNIREYAAPALPLGRKFAGLVYLHGKAGEYEDGNNLVLTSSDFGKAYLTDAYASRFLDEVFKNYTVCFVGYSCNDVIVDRLTRGINSEKKHFAIVEKDFDVWEERDITPIKFTVNKNDYSKEEDLLQKISEIVLETTDLQAKRIDELISSSTPSVLEISENGKLKYMENVLKKNDVSVFDFIKFLESGSEEVSSKLKILNIFSNSVCKSGFFNEWLEWVFSQKLNCIDILCKKIQLKNSYYPVLPFSETIIRGLVSRGDSIFEIIESMFVGHGGMMNDSLICEIITRVLTNKNSYKKKVKINSKITSFLCQVLIPQLSLKCNSNYFGFYLKDLEWKGNENVILTYFLRIFEPFVTYDIGISNSYYQKVGTIYDKYHFGSLSKFLKNNHLDVNFNERFYLQIKKIYFRYSDFLENNVVLGDGLFRVQECIDRINHYLRPVHDAYITCVSNIPKVKTDTELVELFSFDREEMQALGLDVLEVLLENNRLLRSRKYIDLIIEKRIFETSEFASKIIKIIKKNQIKLTKTQQDKIIKVINSKPLKMRNHEFYQKPENIEEWRYRMLLNFSKLDYFDKVKELKIQHKIKYPEMWKWEESKQTYNEYWKEFIGFWKKNEYVKAFDSITDIERLDYQNLASGEIEDSSNFVIEKFCKDISNDSDSDNYLVLSELLKYLLNFELYKYNDIYSQVIAALISKWRDTSNYPFVYNYDDLDKKLEIYKDLIEVFPGYIGNFSDFCKQYISKNSNDMNIEQMLEIAHSYLDAHDNDNDLGWLSHIYSLDIVYVSKKCTINEQLHHELFDVEFKKIIDNYWRLKNKKFMESILKEFAFTISFLYELYPLFVEKIFNKFDNYSGDGKKSFCNSLFSNTKITSRLLEDKNFQLFMNKSLEMYKICSEKTQEGLLDFLISGYVFFDQNDYKTKIYDIVSDIAIKKDKEDDGDWFTRIKNFYNVIKMNINNYVRNDNTKELSKYWDVFLCEFFRNRCNHSPVQTPDYEFLTLLSIVPTLQSHVGDALKLIESNVHNIDLTKMNLFFPYIQIHDKDLTDNNEDDILDCLLLMLNLRGINSHCFEIENLVKDILSTEKVKSNQKYSEIVKKYNSIF